MMEYKPSLTIDLNSIKEGLSLTIEERTNNLKTLFERQKEQEGIYEAVHQLVEGQFYDYEFSNSLYSFREQTGKNNSVVHPRKSKPYMGTLAPNIYVGTLKLDIVHKDTLQTPSGSVELEVQSLKAGYRDDYRDMLEFITEKCTALLMHSESPVSQVFDVNYEAGYETLYQRFSFVRSVVASDEFTAAVHRIVTAPVTGWKEITEIQDIRQVRRFNGSGIKQITRGTNRQRLPDSHPLKQQGIETLPARIGNALKSDTVDIPENRFIKHALETFAQFCTEIHERAGRDPKSELYRESEEIVNQLETYLQHTVFSDISSPDTLRINSPVLQRKSGYREVLRAWLMFDLAAKLIWRGGDDVYKAGKKDIATLYEYWLFFQLLDLLSNLFSIAHKDLEDLITESSDGLNLTIKQGKETALEGIYESGYRSFNIRFSYNRTFSKAGEERSYPKAGSWTSSMRPDYTLSVWPLALEEAEAELEELIVHIHFDAKYKIENMAKYLKEHSDIDLSEQKNNERKGRYKNADLLKMHAYKDAIRRTGGAYVLYPGTETVKRHGFHEIIPGLGAFPVKPSKDETGIGALKDFIHEVLEHFKNRVSQREKLAQRTFRIHKHEPKLGDSFTGFVPEAFGKYRDYLPDETFVLVGYSKSKAHYAWIYEYNLYNFRMESDAGSLILDHRTVNARYLLIHRPGQTESVDLFEIVSEGPKVYSKEKLAELNYPNPRHDNYLVIKVKPVRQSELQNQRWRFKDFSNYQEGRSKAIPFTTTLAEMIKNRINE